MRLNFRLRILILFLSITIIPFIFYFFFSWQAQKASLQRQLENHMVIMANNLAKSTEQFVNERMSDLKFLAQSLPVTDSPVLLRRRLQEFNSSYPQYDGAIYVNLQGTVIADSNFSAEGKNVSSRSWFKPALNEKYYFSDIYYSPIVKRPLLVLAAPVKRQQTVAAVVSPSVDLNQLWEIIDDFSSRQKTFGQNGYAFLLNQKGFYIAHPKREKILNKNFLTEYNLDPKTLQQISQENNLLYLHQNNSVVALAPIKPATAESISWYAGVIVPEPVLFAPLIKLNRDLFILLVATIIVSLFFSLYLTQSLGKPLSNLLQAIAAYGEGKRPSRLPVETDDEIGRLNKAFNQLVRQLEEREKELIRTEKFKTAGQLAAGMAHEIRNPLTTIKGFLQIAASSATAILSQSQLDIILSEVNRIENIINQFLSISKEVKREKIDINRILQDLLTFCEPKATQMRIIFQRDLAEELPPLELVPDHVKQVFLNLIQNGMESMSEGGRLTITSRWLPAEQMVMVSVSDTGTGMSAEVLSQLGTPFFTTKANGHGLGLMLTYQLVELWGGKILVESTPGQGSTFTILIPVNKAST